MKTFIVEFSSKSHPNWGGEMVIQAPNISVAQMRFLDWVKFEPIWTGLWDLSFTFRKARMCILPTVPQLEKQNDRTNNLLQSDDK